MVEVHKRDGMSDEARINRRLRPSNDDQTADSHTVNGTGPTRVHTTVHRSGTNLHHENPRSRSILRGIEPDVGDNIRPPVAGGPIMGRKGR